MSGIVFGCIVPHPPIIVPAIGRGRQKEVEATINSMEQLAQEMAACRPETVIIISPHGVNYYDAMGVATCADSEGDLTTWGAKGLNYHFDNDPQFVAALGEETKSCSIPMVSIGQRSYELDHGVLVPLYFLEKAMPTAALVPITFCWLPYTIHFAFGQTIRGVAEKLQKRIAVIASGDLSHRLIPGAPAGYAEEGAIFDKRLVEAIGSMDTKAILNLDRKLIERAGECGLRSIIILLGALDGLAVTPQVYSYEGPFGVGYLVASFRVDDQPKTKAESTGG